MSIECVGQRPLFEEQPLQEMTSLCCSSQPLFPSTIASGEEHSPRPNWLTRSWNAVASLFSTCTSCEESGPLCPEAIENRAVWDKSEVAIHRSLHAEMLWCAQQMDREEEIFVPLFQCDTQLDTHREELSVGNSRVGIACAQGKRPAMEDRHLAVAFEVIIAGRNYPLQFFGVFDGHGGVDAARFVRDHLPQYVSAALFDFNMSGLTKAGTWRALKTACVRLNSDFKAKYPLFNSYRHGTTATFAIVLDGHLWTANVGDSRTVLDNGGMPEQLSYDARAEDQRFARSIEKRGGIVVHRDGTMRINGCLEPARAFGDHVLRGAVSARPTITVKALTDIRKRSHLILGSDGVFGFKSTKRVVEFVHAKRSASPSELAKHLVHLAYCAGSNDNLTAMVIKI